MEDDQLWKIRMVLPGADSDMPETITEIVNEMERSYITNDNWNRVQELWWGDSPDVNKSELKPVAAP
ncbi:MAG: hypothetical protein PVG66_01410 [Chromatiales bacterium]|jgi:hypothetical protein